MTPAFRFQDKTYAALILGVIAAALAIQLGPHPWNVAPVGALCLFAGAYLPRAYAILAPLAILFLSTVLTTGLYDPLLMIAVYGGFAISALIGRALLFRRKTALRIAGGVGAGALSFFLITNAASWMLDPMYPKSAGGLIAAYVNGLPFLGRSLAGDVMYAAAFFGVVEGYARLRGLPAAATRKQA